MDFSNNRIKDGDAASDVLGLDGKGTSRRVPAAALQRIQPYGRMNQDVYVSLFQKTEQRQNFFLTVWMFS